MIVVPTSIIENFYDAKFFSKRENALNVESFDDNVFYPQLPLLIDALSQESKETDIMLRNPL